MSKIEKKIDSLKDALHVKKQKDLLRLIHSEISKAGGDGDFDSWLKSHESNFSKMKAGERKFPLEIRYAISELAGTSWTKFSEEGVIDTYDPISFKYVAHKNERIEYERLLKIGGESLFLEEDEFGKTMLDRILEFNDTDEKRETAIRFYAENELWSYSADPEVMLEFILSAIRLDDLSVYGYLERHFRCCGCDYITPMYYDNMVLERELQAKHQEKILDTTLKTENILAAILTPFDAEKTDEISVGNEPSYRLENAIRFLERALETENPVAERILMAYVDEIGVQCERFRGKHGAVPIDRLDSHSYKYNGITYWDNKGCYYVAVNSCIYKLGDSKWNIIKARYPEIYEKIEKENVKYSLSMHDTSALKDGEEIVDSVERKIYRRTKKSLGHEFLELAAENGFTQVPMYYGEEKGVQIVELCALGTVKFMWCEDLNAKTLSEIVEALSAIHALSEKKLGEGCVYALSDFDAAMSSFWRRGDGLLVLDGWTNGGSEIKSPENALVDFSLAVLYRAVKQPFGNESGAKELITALDSYSYGINILDSFGDKLLSEIERRIAEIDRKSNKHRYMMLANVRGVIEAYIDEFNSISPVKNNE